MKKTMTKRFLFLLCCMHLLCCSFISAPAKGEEGMIFSYMNRGMCKKMTGCVQVLGVFVDVGNETWTEDEKQDKKSELQRAAQQLESQAASYGQELSFSIEYSNALTENHPHNQDSRKWAENCLLGNMDFRRKAEKLKGKENRLTIFMIASSGRSVASRDGAQYPEEFALTYDDDVAENYMHEMLHLFGAMDYYYPDAYKAAAKKYFPDSIMYLAQKGNRVDSLTAHLIGWTNKLSPEAAAFVEETKHVTQEDIRAALKEAMKDGYAMVESDGNLYWGQLQDGLKTGFGVLRWGSGEQYHGEFIGGILHGIGVTEWTGGEVFAGSYQQGNRTGKGTMIWNNKTFYTGDFVNGQREGYGLLRYNNGDVQIGRVKNNAFESGSLYIRKTGNGYDRKCIRLEKTGADYYGEISGGLANGYGMLVWSDGRAYYGEFKDGLQHGTGVMQWTDGIVYCGEYLHGEATGRGAYIWPDGALYVGEILNGKMHGEAALRHSSGLVYTGAFENGKKNGSGMMIWQDGGIYIGEFANDTMHGQGTYTAPDGRVSEGKWKDGKYVGK